ncbi:PepSY domain-containing protein [Sphingomonas sp. Root50]|uniref:PepSY domain-containing protein n=1 Tax=Sphingomonas sp. Root50 TaxID=1736551 RepID=UPI001F307EA2|nr:PepSY domain-containing protein [Sphingomonas sp. Root50]
MLDRPTVAIGYVDGRRRLLDLASGREIRIDRTLAERIVRAAYKGPAVMARTQAVTSSSTEYRGALPAWQVALNDADATRVYVDAATGRIAAVRTNTWRLYDFFWGLHIMDWKNHEDFNTPWLMAFAVGSLGLGVAGTVLLYMRWPRRFRHRRTAV